MQNDLKKTKIGCIIMASGLSVRFGSNKLLAEFQGNTLIQRTLELTEEIFTKLIVLTRSEDVYNICKEQNIEVILHKLPTRNEAVHLGVEQMDDMDACIFIPCDQPLLRRASVLRILDVFRQQTESVDSDKAYIFRLGYGERQGSPILFEKSCFPELKDLPEKKGGSYLAKKYPEKTMIVQAEDLYELEDVDTREDLNKLEKI